MLREKEREREGGRGRGRERERERENEEENKRAHEPGTVLTDVCVVRKNKISMYTLVVRDRKHRLTHKELTERKSWLK